MPIKKTRLIWKTILVFFIITSILTVSIKVPVQYGILRNGVVICCILLIIAVINRFRTKKATLTLIKKEGDDAITWYAISINGSKPGDDEWFSADGNVTIQDIVYDESGISYRLFIHHKDGQLSKVQKERHKLTSG